MKFCTFKRNDSGQIIRVNKPDGSESKLFTKIAKHPLVKTTEGAADIFKNIFTKDLQSRAKDTQEFFSSTVKGENKKYIPSKAYSYDYKFNEKEENFKADYQPRLGDFDDHIATSIPTFRDIQVKKGTAITEMYKDTGAVMYDLGGSEGGFVKSITSVSGGAIETINIDANEDMIASHNNNPVEGSQGVREAFLEGFDDVPAHQPAKKADVVHESMLFQFITPQREKFVDEVIDKYIKDDGIFITEEKFQTKDMEQYKKNELQKNKYHKGKYYTKEQIQTKGESVLVGMQENQAMIEDYLSLLRKKFKYVEVYWTAGNFKGIVASNDQAKVQEFLERLGDTSSVYSGTKPGIAGQLNEQTGTLLLPTAQNTDYVKNADFEPKDETHITIIGFRVGRIIKGLSEGKKDAINNLIAATNFSFTRTGDLFTITKDYPENKYQKAHTRQAVVETINLPALNNFYKKLSEIVGQELEVPFPHITIGTRGNSMGIGVNSKADFDSMSPTSIMIKDKEEYSEDDVRITTPIEFKNAMQQALDNMEGLSNKIGLQVDEMSLTELQNIVKDGGKLFLTKDNLSGGFVKANGYMGGLFKNPSSSKARASKALQNVRIAAGGKYFDAYSTELESIYIKNGFKPVARIPFNEDMAPKGWDAENSPLNNKPDVTFYIYAPNESANLGEGQFFKSYDKAEEFTLSKVNPTQELKEDTNYPEDNMDFVHRLADGSFANSFLDALRHTKEGGTLEIGFMIDGKFTPIVLARRNTNKNTEQGYINNQILNTVVSDKKVKVGLEYRYQIAGETELAKMLNMSILRDDITAYMGFGSLELDGTTFNINKTRGKIRIMTPSGELVMVTKEELNEMTYEEVKAKFDSYDEIIAMREWEASKVAYREQEPVVSQRAPVKSEEELQMRLLNFLGKLGVKTMSISEYVKKYKMRHGVNPSAKALADIANQVVAYTKGDVDSLSEEVAHFINEAFPKEKIENILRNIHKTAEWAEFNKQYREIYSKEYQGAELEDVMRREVLGKIVAKVISGQVNSQNNTELQRNLFERVVDAVREFFTKLRTRFKSEYDVELNQYLNEVEQLLAAEDISDLVNVSNFKNSTIRLYNVGNTNSDTDLLRKKAQLLASQQLDMERRMLNEGTGSKVNARELKRVQAELQKNVEVSSIMSLVSMVDANVRALNAAIEDSEKNKKAYFLSSEEAVVYHNVKEISSKALKEIQGILIRQQKEEKTRKWDTILKEIEGTISEIAKLEGRANIIDSQNVQKLVNNIMDKYPIAAENREMIEKWIEHAESDTNLFHSTFGQLIHAKDGMLNLAGTIINDMHLFAHERLLNSVKPYQDRLRELGITESDIGIEFVDGQYILSEYDFNKFERANDIIYAQTFQEVATEALKNPNTEASAREEFEKISKMTLEEVVTAKNNSELPTLDLQQETSRKNKERPLTTALIERTMVDTYYEEYEAKLEKANISEVTKQRLSDYFSSVSAIKKKAYKKEGDKTILDFDSLTEFEKENLSELHKKRKMMKSYIDETGEPKPGLKFVTKGGKVMEDPETGQPIIDIADPNKLTEESIVALEINRLDKEFAGEREQQSAKLFYETLDKIDRENGREAALKFLEANAYIGLSNEFWSNIRTGGGIIAKLEAFKAKNPSKVLEVNMTLNSIRLTSYKIKQIIKVHNKKNNPAEVETSLMSDTAINSVKLLQDDLRSDIQKAKQIIGDESELTLEESGLLEGVSEVNQSYMGELKDRNVAEDPQYDTEQENFEKVEQEIEFAVTHMTDENSSNLQKDRISIARFEIGNRTSPTSRVEYALENLGYTLSDLRASKGVQAEVLRYLTRRSILPYFKRYTSEGYTEFMDGMESTPNISNYLQNSSLVNDAFVEINPNATFFDEQENKNINPNRRQDFEGGYLQPKLSNITLPNTPEFANLRAEFGDTVSFKNEKYTEKFGEVTDGVSSKNANLYQAYLATKKFNSEALKAMNIGSTHNQFRLPQIRQQDIQRASTMLKGNVGANTKNFIKDLLSYTEDDMIQGETVYGSDIKVIPKMYINKLENPEDISNDLFYTLALRAKEAYARESKVKHYGDLMSIYDKVSNRTMHGKDSSKSNSLKMLRSAIDYNLFGIKESATYPVKTMFGVTVDLTKLARMLLKFIKFRNLGLNVVIPLTSLITGEVTRKMEAVTGEFIDSRSQALGRNEFRRLAPGGMKEIGKINTESKLNVLGQFFKSFDIMDSFKHSNYNKTLRFLPRMSMALHTAANYGIYGKTLLGVLHDFRVVDGKMVNRNDFMSAQKAAGNSKKDAKAEWRRYEDKAMYGYLVHDKNQISWNRDALKQDLLKDGEQLTEDKLTEAINDMYARAQKHAQMVNSLIDGQIPEEDRVLAQRHFLLSYFMTHRGWLSIAIARRFKNRHLNLNTLQLEEGSYRSVYNYMGAMFKEMQPNNFYKFAKHFKAVWNDPTGINESGISEKERKNRMRAAELVRKNMTRVLIESSVLTSIMILSLVLRGFADDDDNEDMFALQMTNYLVYRTINELSSVQGNVGSNIWEAIDSPFVGMNTIKNFFDVAQIFSGEEVKYGSYRGMSERQRWITKMVPGMKQGFDLANMNQTYETYKFYNTKNFSLTPANMLWLNYQD
jgi:hypothetical protein